MASGVGGCFEASPVSNKGVIVSDVTGAPMLRTSTVATPGTTSGVRTVTKEFVRAYGQSFEDILVSNMPRAPVSRQRSHSPAEAAPVSAA